MKHVAALTIPVGAAHILLLLINPTKTHTRSHQPGARCMGSTARLQMLAPLSAPNLGGHSDSDIKKLKTGIRAGLRCLISASPDE